MVQLRTLTAEEVAAVFPKRGQIDISEYVSAISQIRPGEAAEIEIDGLTRRSIKRRVGQAARQIGVTLKWARAYDDDETLIFQVRALSPSKNRTPRARRRTPVVAGT